MPVWMRAALTCCCLVGCASGAGGQRQMRQAVGPGPGPGCASTLDCACKRGSAAACEQLGATMPRPQAPRPPGPVLPPGTGKAPVTGEPSQEVVDRCTEYYNRCVDAGGERLRGHLKGYTRCSSCLDKCTADGFWPEAIYTWNDVRLPCPGI